MADAELIPRVSCSIPARKKRPFRIEAEFLVLLLIAASIPAAALTAEFPGYAWGIALSFGRSETALFWWKENMHLDDWAIPIVFACQTTLDLFTFWAEDRIAGNKRWIGIVKGWLRNKLWLNHITIKKRDHEPAPAGWRIAMYGSLVPLVVGFETMPLAVSLVKVHRLNRIVSILIILSATLAKDWAVAHAIDFFYRSLGGILPPFVWTVSGIVVAYLSIKFLLEE